MRAQFLAAAAILAVTAAPASASPVLLAVDLGNLGIDSAPAAINQSGQITGTSTTDLAIPSAFITSKTGLLSVNALGPESSSGTAINDAGQITGWIVPAGGAGVHAMLSDGHSFSDLGTLGGTNSFGSAINNAGQIAGFSDTGSGATHAFLYTGGAMLDLGTLGGLNSQAAAINASGQTTGLAYTAANTAHAFISDATTHALTDLGTLGGSASTGLAINSAGKVTGVADLPGDVAQHAFVAAGGTMTDLGTLGGMNSGGVAINGAGQVTGYADTAGTGFQAFVSDGAGMTELSLGGTYGQGEAINSQGNVAGYSDTVGNTAQDAFVYLGGVMYDLNTVAHDNRSLPADVHLIDAMGINDKNQIIALGCFTSGTREGTCDAFEVYVPEPAELPVLAVPAIWLLGLAALRRRFFG